jgi:hypothetical protein
LLLEDNIAALITVARPENAAIPSRSAYHWGLIDLTTMDAFVK